MKNLNAVAKKIPAVIITTGLSLVFAEAAEKKAPPKEVPPLKRQADLVVSALPWGGWYCGLGAGLATFTEDYNDAVHEKGLSHERNKSMNLKGVYHSGFSGEIFGGYGIYVPDSRIYTGLELRTSLNSYKAELNERLDHDSTLVQKARIPWVTEFGARIGYRVREDSMIYARFGGVLASFNNDQAIDMPNAVPPEHDVGNHNGFVWGGRVGVGLETALVGEHIIRLEVNYMITNPKEVKTIYDDKDAHIELLSGKIQFRTAEVTIQYVFAF